MKFIEYPKCSTCKKAKKWLDNHKIDYIDIDITKETPTAIELKRYLKISNLPIKRFFNTSGLVYRNLNLKNKLDEYDLDAKLNLLASNGKLIKRPLLVDDDFVLVGFNEKEWDKIL